MNRPYKYLFIGAAGTTVAPTNIFVGAAGVFSRPYKSICRGGYSTNRPYKSFFHKKKLNLQFKFMVPILAK